MPRITKVYTRKGDGGMTGLGTSARVPKESLRVAAYGTVDEASSYVGVAMASGLTERLVEPLRRTQNDLFHLGSDLCIPEEDKKTIQVPQVEERHVVYLEELMDELSEELEPLANFVLPGGDPAAAHLHLARAVCRRAERDVVALSREEVVGRFTIPYLNRLSDALFVMARYQNLKAGVDEILWDSRA